MWHIALSSSSEYLESIRETHWRDVGVTSKVHRAIQLDDGNVIVKVA